jgi:hypothetical protein
MPVSRPDQEPKGSIPAGRLLERRGDAPPRQMTAKTELGLLTHSFFRYFYTFFILYLSAFDSYNKLKILGAVKG